MSSNYPARPDPTSPKRRESRHTHHRDRPSSRRRRPSDVEASPYEGHRHHRRRSSSTRNRPQDTYIRAAPSPGILPGDQDPMMAMSTQRPSHGLHRKKSLVRPERNRIDKDHPNYHYRKHAQNMAVLPSSTGNDPMVEDRLEAETFSSEETDIKSFMHPESAVTEEPLQGRARRGRSATVETAHTVGGRKLQKTLSRKDTRALEAEDKRRQKEKDDAMTPNLWSVYCHLVTFWCPDAILRCFGKPQKAQQRAWREKMGLISIILLICTFVGFLTFGFTQVVCPNGGPTRLRTGHIGSGYMVFHGQAYDLTRSRHPLARGIAAGGNVLWDMDEPHGGQDGSFLFQNVNGACKNLITLAPNSDVPTDPDGNLAWYFPCNTFNQNGTSPVNKTIPYYFGYGCHTSKGARIDFYGLRSAGDVFYTWDDVKNTSRNLMVYSGDVLDLDLLEWFNTTQVSYPARFDKIRTNPAIKGVDATLAFSSGEDRQIAQCFQDIIKVGSIDTATVGCIASKVVLYVSLVFILAIVITKFLLALVFQWFLCRRFGATKTTLGPDSKKRQQQIEDWSDDIYRPPPKLSDPVSSMSERSSKRNSFLPTTSRFTSPYAIERIPAKNRAPPTTMASQSSTSRLLPTQVYGHTNRSEGTLPTYIDSQGKLSTPESRASFINSGSSEHRYSSVLTEREGAGPQGFIHEAVVPQPPPDWQPFGYPLAHAICLITAYSEGPEGIRSTLDSVATTDYPNSHKLILCICDGLIKGKGETMSTPEVCLSMMKDHVVLPNDVQAFSYVAVASGSKRHNMAKIYSGFYDYGENSVIPLEKQQRVPMMVVVKCGTPDEATKSKPGNRGKRDSQIILMSFLQKVMFDERMTELEFEMFNGIWKITGISPDFYEIVLMVDADTKVFPDSLTHMISAMVKDPEIMGLCGETKIANKRQSWVSMIQVFEYFISHHLSKSFESVFGGVTCLPGCFCMYRIKAPKGGQNYWVPILANPDVVEHYSENVVDTLHKKNLLLLGEDRYLSTLMLKTFPKRKQVFVPQAVCKTTVPEEFKVLLSQRRRWINSTVHNLMELVLVRDLCGTFCFSMQFVVFIELVGTLVLPAAISFTIYLVAIAIKAAITHTEAPTIPLILLALILGLPAVLIVLT
ncbi:Chitin synthase, class 3, partial [Elasticomyces elasticus]